MGRIECQKQTCVVVLQNNFAIFLNACNFIKKRLQHRCFALNIAKFLRTAFFIEHIQWLLMEYDVFQKQPLEVFYKKGVLKNFAKFTGKQLCWRFF